MKTPETTEPGIAPVSVRSINWVDELEAEASRAEKLMNVAASHGDRALESAWRSYRNGIRYALNPKRSRSSTGELSCGEP